MKVTKQEDLKDNQVTEISKDLQSLTLEELDDIHTELVARLSLEGVHSLLAKDAHYDDSIFSQIGEVRDAAEAKKGSNVTIDEVVQEAHDCAELVDLPTSKEPLVVWLDVNLIKGTFQWSVTDDRHLNSLQSSCTSRALRTFCLPNLPTALSQGALMEMTGAFAEKISTRSGLSLGEDQRRFEKFLRNYPVSSELGGPTINLQEESFTLFINPLEGDK